MKISGCVFQKSKIKKYTEDHFEATYKGRYIYISTDHGLGKPEYNHLKRYNIEVSGIENMIFDVDTYEDCHDIREAIYKALKGAMLIS